MCVCVCVSACGLWLHVSLLVICAWIREHTRNNVHDQILNKRQTFQEQHVRTPQLCLPSAPTISVAFLKLSCCKLSERMAQKGFGNIG